jgi:carboxymethylenebutenolidase
MRRASRGLRSLESTCCDWSPVLLKWPNLAHIDVSRGVGPPQRNSRGLPGPSKLTRAFEVVMQGSDVQLPPVGGVASKPAYAAVPAGVTRGMVVLHEAFGRQPESDRVVERLARSGYAAVAPTLFGSLTERGCVRSVTLALREGRGPFAEQIRAARTWLCSEAALPEAKVGLIGFCMGGAFALAVGRGWGAVSTNYGVLPPDALLEGLGPTIGCYGGKDRVLGRTGPKLEKRLQALGVPVETHTFPTVGHSFLTDADSHLLTRALRPIMGFGYDPEVADDAWTKILAFLDKAL